MSPVIRRDNLLLANMGFTPRVSRERPSRFVLPVLLSFGPARNGGLLQVNDEPVQKRGLVAMSSLTEERMSSCPEKKN
jgi:hypothetical protein